MDLMHADTYPSIRRAPHGAGYIGTRRCVFDGEIGACAHRHRTISAALACAEYGSQPLKGHDHADSDHRGA